MWFSRGCLGAPAISDAWLCHVSIVGGARRRGCAAGGVPVFFRGLLGVEGVGGDALGEAGSNGGRGRTPGLASGLVLERRQELGDEVKPRKALDDLGPQGRGPGVGVAAADIEPGPLAQEMALDVE